MRTYSLAEFTAIALPPGLKDPERWLRERLNKGVLRGYRSGRTWRMTERQLEYNLEIALANTNRTSTPKTVDDTEPGLIQAGLSERGRARIQRQLANIQDRRLA